MLTMDQPERANKHIPPVSSDRNAVNSQSDVLLRRTPPKCPPVKVQRIKVPPVKVQRGPKTKATAQAEEKAQGNGNTSAESRKRKSKAVDDGDVDLAAVHVENRNAKEKFRLQSIEAMRKWTTAELADGIEARREAASNQQEADRRTRMHALKMMRPVMAKEQMKTAVLTGLLQSKVNKTVDEIKSYMEMIDHMYAPKL